MQARRLNTGTNIPMIGFGTWEIGPDNAERTVTTALQAGYRLIDTAKIYGNERSVGAAVRSASIPREEIFVTTKLWNDDHSYESALAALDASLQKLGLDYVDLYLIHWPASAQRDEAWRGLEELYKQGKAKNIGVSNYTVEHLRQLLETSNTVPAVNQIEFHPFVYRQQKELLNFCKQHGIVVEAYSPLSRLAHENNTLIHQVAERSGASPQQVVLRWCVQHETIPLPRSGNHLHMKANLDIFDFELSDNEMQILDSIGDV